MQEATVNEIMGFGHHTPTKSALPGTGTFSPTSLLREVMQEAVVNEIMGFGRHQKASVVPRPSGVIHYEVDAFDPFSTPSRIASPHPGLAHIYLVPQQRHREDEPCSAEQQETNEEAKFSPEPELYSCRVDNETCLKEHLVGDGRNSPTSRSPSPEQFYRSSSGYISGFSTIPSPIMTQRPLTPYPGRGFPLTKRSSRHYASVPLPSSQQRTFTDDSPRRASSVRRSKAPPIRLPADYRAETPFSFTQPTTPTAFSRSNAPILTPGHPYYNAKRIGGVELEYRSLEKAAEAKTGMHRAMWPEERQDMLEEIDEMARTLARNLGKVRNEDGIGRSRQGGFKEVAIKDGENKKMGWLKRLVHRKTKAQSPRAVNSRSASGQNPSGDFASIAPYAPKPARESRRHSTSIVVPSNDASPSPAIAIRRTERAFVIAPSPVQLPPAPKTKKRQWWHLGSTPVKKGS
jgi:hypothetical protein